MPSILGDRKKKGNQNMNEIIKKVQLVFKKSRNAKIFICAISIVVVYMFFFTSKTIFHVQGEKKNTEINSVTEFEQRKVTLAKWVYCKDTQTMEVEFDIVNSNYDGNDQYVFSVVDRKQKIYDFEVLFSNPTMAVLQVHNVQEDFSEMRIQMKVDYGNNNLSTEAGKFYVNNDTVECVNSIVTYHTMEDYYVAKLSRYIDNYNKQIEEITAKMMVEVENEDNCYKQINDLNLQKNYIAGDELNNINTQINEINKKAIEYGKLAYKYNQEIEEIQKKIKDYENIMKLYQSTDNHD